MRDMVFTVTMLICAEHLSIKAQALNVFQQALELGGMLDPAVTADDKSISFTAQVEGAAIGPAMRQVGEVVGAAMGAAFGLEGIRYRITHSEVHEDNEEFDSNDGTFLRAVAG